MATRRRRFGLGILFVLVVAFVPLRIFHNQVIKQLAPYTGGKSLCAQTVSDPKLAPLATPDKCPVVNQSAYTLVNITEKVLLTSIIIICLYIGVKWLIQRIRRSSA
ncbi:MAG TPA: hypothetical protein VK534_00320 [Methylomirabilota bacterium]|nr:hypothetical protein [Methylomirabilota bacterium]